MCWGLRTVSEAWLMEILVQLETSTHMPGGVLILPLLSVGKDAEHREHCPGPDGAEGARSWASDVPCPRCVPQGTIGLCAQLRP